MNLYLDQQSQFAGRREKGSMVQLRYAGSTEGLEVFGVESTIAEERSPCDLLFGVAGGVSTMPAGVSLGTNEP
jgi:hypothetical protein